MFCVSTFFVSFCLKSYIFTSQNVIKGCFCMIFVMFYSVLLFTKKTFNLNKNYEQTKQQSRGA